MGIEFKAAEIEQLATGTAVLYTCPANTTAQIVSAVANNIDASSNTTFTITVTPSGGSAAQYVSARPIPHGKSDPVSELWGIVLDSGDSINAFASVASDINLKIGVVERT